MGFSCGVRQDAAEDPRLAGQQELLTMSSMGPARANHRRPMSAHCGGLSRALGLAAVLMVLVAGCDRGDSTAAQPTWLPERISGLSIRVGDLSSVTVSSDRAASLARRRLFLGRGPVDPPDVIPTVITGKVAGRRPVSASKPVELRGVEDHPSWMVVWRDVSRGDLDPSGAVSSSVRVDVVAFVDADSGAILATFVLAGPTRLH